MLYEDSKAVFEKTLAVLRQLVDLPPIRQQQVLAAAQLALNFEAARAQQKPEVRDE